VVDRLADRRLLGVAEDLLAGAVDPDDPPVGVDLHERVHHRVHQVLEVVGVFPDRLREVTSGEESKVRRVVPQVVRAPYKMRPTVYILPVGRARMYMLSDTSRDGVHVTFI